MVNRQEGVIHRDQLLRSGLSPKQVRGMRQRQILIPVFGEVFSLGHGAISHRGRLIAALLHAGRGSALCSWTALHWWGLLDVPRSDLHVCTTRRAGSVGGLIVHSPRSLERVVHRGLPVTPVARTIRDLAPQLSLRRMREIIAEAEYRRILDLEELRGALGQGHRGARLVRTALRRHQPLLARTRSELERAFLALIERHALPMPQVSYPESRMRVDAVWPELKVAVELDGGEGHRTVAQLNRDHRRDLELRARGYTVLRYSYDQVIRSPELVLADLRRALGHDEGGAEASAPAR